MPRWSGGGALTPPDTMGTGSMPKVTAPTRWIWKCSSVRSIQSNSITNATYHWEGAGVPRLAKDDGVRNPQPQRDICLQRLGLR